MRNNDWKDRLGILYSTNPDFQYDTGEEEEEDTLPKEKQDQAKAIIALNKFEDGDYECDDSAILEVLSYYKITRDIAEAEA